MPPKTHEIHLRYVIPGGFGPGQRLDAVHQSVKPYNPRITEDYLFLGIGGATFNLNVADMDQLVRNLLLSPNVQQIIIRPLKTDRTPLLEHLRSFSQSLPAGMDRTSFRVQNEREVYHESLGYLATDEVVGRFIKIDTTRF